MNPVLLKPMSDCVSQVVLNGRPFKDIAISEYYKETPQLLKKARESYHRLKSAFGEVVIEGAGGQRNPISMTGI